MGSGVSQPFLLQKSDLTGPRRILMLGLDAAGKTSIVYRLKFKEPVVTVPTIGFNVEEIKFRKGLRFTIWDIGGQDKIRLLWRHYYRNSRALIYVIDSNDIERLKEAKNELFSILESDDMKQIPVIVMANKQDLPNAISVEKLIDVLELRKLDACHKWHIQGCCSISGDGLLESMEMVGKLSTEFIKINERKYR